MAKSSVFFSILRRHMLFIKGKILKYEFECGFSKVRANVYLWIANAKFTTDRTWMRQGLSRCKCFVMRLCFIVNRLSHQLVLISYYNFFLLDFRVFVILLRVFCGNCLCFYIIFTSTTTYTIFYNVHWRKMLFYFLLCLCERIQIIIIIKK